MNEVVYRCVMPGRPGILKNGKKLFVDRNSGRAKTTASDRYHDWAPYAKEKLIEGMGEVFQRINFPVNMEFKIFLCDHQHEPDTSNCYEGVQDLMAKVGVIKNDKLIYCHDGSGKFFGASWERIEITLTRIPPERYTAND